MKNKQQLAEILSFISLIICIIEIILFFLLSDCNYGEHYLPTEDLLSIAPLIVLLALILSSISLFFNKKQLLSWGILILVLSLLPRAIYLWLTDHFSRIKF